MSNTNRPTDTPPSLTARAFRYTRALSRWIKAGRPSRTVGEIATIFEEHCLNCPEMNERLGRCNACGCHVGLRAAPLLNKIAMGTEHCPLEKW